MDWKNKDLLNRIVFGYYPTVIEYQGNYIPLTFIDPPREVVYKGEVIAKKMWQGKVDTNSVWTLEETIELLKERGDWSDELEQELKKTTEDISRFRKALPSYKFQKSQHNRILFAIKQAEEKQNQLTKQKYQLYHTCLEAQMESAKRRYVMRNSVELPDEHINLLSHEHFLNLLTVYYYDREYPSEGQLRKLARGSEWRHLWVAAKDLGQNVFKTDFYNLNQIQADLLVWSKVYDWAYQHPKRPEDSVIDNDSEFDVWYEKAVKDELGDDDDPRDRFGGKSQVFIPSDPEGAKEVWAMNDPETRHRMKKRFAKIKKEGAVRECDLPDVQEELRMQANRLAIDSAMNRNKK